VKGGTNGGGWLQSGVVAPDGTLYYTDGTYGLFEVRPDGAQIAWPNLPLGRLHLNRDGTLTAARPLAQRAPQVLGKVFTSAGKDDILLLKVDLAGVTALRRIAGPAPGGTSRTRFTPLGRRAPERTTAPLPLYPLPARIRR
jgi:hypothetical protein